MAVALVQNRAFQTEFTTSIARAYSSDVTAGNLLVVWCWAGDNSTDDTASWVLSDTRGNSYTLLVHDNEPTFSPFSSTGSKHGLFACVNVGSGANTVTVTFPEEENFSRMVIWEFSGAESDANAITFKMNDYRHSLGITSSNGVVMPTVDGVVDGYVGSCVQNLGAGGSDYTAGTGYSNLVGTGAAGYAAGAGKTTSAAGPQTPTFTSNDSAGEHYGVSFVIQPPFTMPTGPFNPPTKGETFSLSVGLASISNPGSFQINPTISLGDFKVSKDGGALANLATQPVVRPGGSQSVILSLSSTEMDADVVTIVGIDQTGPKEWEDLEISIPTTGA